MENKKRGRPAGIPKTGGRKSGTPNAITGDLRSFYARLIDDNRTEIIKRLKRLDDASFFQALDRINKYVLPTLTSVSNEVTLKNKLDKLSDVKLEQLIDNLTQEGDLEDE